MWPNQTEVSNQRWCTSCQSASSFSPFFRAVATLVVLSDSQPPSHLVQPRALSPSSYEYRTCFSSHFASLVISEINEALFCKTGRWMHAVEITNFLDEKISELIKDRLPEEPGYPSGESQYASFIMPRDEMNHHDKSPKWSTNGRSNGSYEGADHKSKHDRAGSSSKSR